MRIGDRVFVKSDGSKSQARDQYLLLNFVPNKNEAELQKIGKKKNIVQVQLQNILSVESDEPGDYHEETDFGEDEPKDNIEDNNVNKVNKPKEENYRKQVKLGQCHFCIKMNRKRYNHHYTECESLLQIRPELKKYTKKEKKTDTDESSDDDQHIEPQSEINLILYSDDELEDLSLQETILSASDYQLNLMDEENIEINQGLLLTPERILNNPENVDTKETDSEIEDHVDSDSSDISMPRSLQTNILKDPDHSNFDALSTIQDEGNGVQDVDGGEQQDYEAIQVPVIQHDGCCTPQSSPPPRSRLGGRSLPGRSIENRNLNVNTSHPGNSSSIAGRVVHTGDVIKYVTGEVHEHQQLWLQATVQKMFKTVQRLHPTYCNIVNERGEEISLELIPGNHGWQILREGTWQFVDDGERRPA